MKEVGLSEVMLSAVIQPILNRDMKRL